MEKSKMFKVEIKVTPVTANGTTFNTYKILNRSKKWVDLRFTKKAKNIPEKSCIAYIDINNLQYSDKYKYPRYWCQGIERIEGIEIKQSVVTDDFDIVE